MSDIGAAPRPKLTDLWKILGIPIADLTDDQLAEWRDLVDSLGVSIADLTDDQLADIRLNIERVMCKEYLLRLAASGKPLFDKATIKTVEDSLDAAVTASDPTFLVTWTAWDERPLQVCAPWDLDNSKRLPFLEFWPFEAMLQHLDYCVEPTVCPKTFSPYVFISNEYPKPGEMDVEHWTQEFDVGVAEWAQSDECKKLVSVLVKCGDAIKTINKVVCFGNGDFHPHGCDDHSHGNRSISQHAAALTVQNFLQEKNGQDIPLFAQDPEYTAPVIEVLEARGFTVYKGVSRGSHGFIDVDDNTFVMSISPVIPTFNIITNYAKPAIVMKDGWFKTEQEHRDWCKDVDYDFPLGNNDSMEGVVKKLLAEEYDEIIYLTENFFRDDVHGPFANVFLYSRKIQPADANQMEKDVDIVASMDEMTMNAGNPDPEGDDDDDDPIKAEGSEVNENEDIKENIDANEVALV